MVTNNKYHYNPSGQHYNLNIKQLGCDFVSCNVGHTSSMIQLPLYYYHSNK